MCVCVCFGIIVVRCKQYTAYRSPVMSRCRTSHTIIGCFEREGHLRRKLSSPFFCRDDDCARARESSSVCVCTLEYVFLVVVVVVYWMMIAVRWINVIWFGRRCRGLCGSSVPFVCVCYACIGMMFSFKMAEK